MNGTKSDDHQLFPSQIIKQEKKKLAIKFCLLMFLGQIFQYLLISPSTKREHVQSRKSLLLELDNHVPALDSSAQAALYTLSGKLIAPSVVIRSYKSNYSERSNIYEVSVYEKDLNLVLPHIQEKLASFPLGSSSEALRFKQLTARSTHEIIY